MIQKGLLSISLLLFFTSTSFAKEYVVGFQKGHFKSVTPSMQFLSSQPVQIHKNLEMMVVDVDSRADLLRLQTEQGVKFVEALSTLKAPAKIYSRSLDTYVNPSKGLVKYPWGILELDAPAAWRMSKAGEGVKVLVLDTGIDKEHPNIAARFVEGRNLITEEENPDLPYSYFDQAGHGTHVAGTILADGLGTGVVGVAPSASLYVGRVCGLEGCPGAAILAGVEWAIEAQMDVVNMSLGGRFGSEAGAQIYAKAEEAGVVIVAASGNDGESRISYPAKYPSVLSVGAIDAELNVAEFSNYDSDLDVVAPGVDILSSIPQGTGRDGKASFSTETAVINTEVFPVDGSIDGVINGKDVVYVGLGLEKDFEGLDLSGKVALIQRGEIAFADKAKGALAANAEAVIIFNNVDEPLRATFGDTLEVVAVTMSMKDGNQLLQNLIPSEEGAQAGQVLANIQVTASDFGALQGTSMATPHVTGLVALVIATNSELSPIEVKNIVKTSALSAPEGAEKEKYGLGIVNAFRAVEAALKN